MESWPEAAYDAAGNAKSLQRHEDKMADDAVVAWLLK
jgi:hypothetical protein